jgi:hypothetical protein
MKYSPKQKALGGIIFSLIMIATGSLLPLILLKTQPAKNQIVVYGLELVAAAGLGLQFLIYLMNWSRRPLSLYLVAAVLSLPCLALIAS